jgi:hypothetical protein
MLTGNPGQAVHLVVNQFSPCLSAEPDIQKTGNTEKEQQNNSNIRQRISDKNGGSALSHHV